MFERYTENARQALFFARYETSETGGLTIDTEHLLLGLLRSRKGVTEKLLADGQVSYDDVRWRILKGTGAREKVRTSVEIPFGAETKRVLQYAAEEADRLLHSYIGSEHLLLGLLREEGSVAASILNGHGLRLGPVREDLVKMLNEGTERQAEPVDVSERIEVIKLLVEQLQRATADDAEALVRRIHHALDALKQQLP